MIRPLSAALALILSGAAAAAHPAMTANDTTMRAAPSARAHIVQQIPAHAQIDIAECRDRWCEASWRNLDGWVRVDAIAPNDAPLAAAAPGPYVYFGGPFVVGPAFGYGYYYRRHW